MRFLQNRSFYGFLCKISAERRQILRFFAVTLINLQKNSKS